ncbi:hypothetical protein [uncultured Gimesia sp.]|uniref:hypothetical protein n=1 Tax=uncultured Gimesia sp. TaxID=1678688 RepID=UPI0030DD3F15
MNSEELLDCIPFISTTTDLALADQYYREPTICRITLQAEDKLRHQISDSKFPLWVDPGVDGFFNILTGKQSFQKYASKKKTSEKNLEAYNSRKQNKTLNKDEQKPGRARKIPWVEFFANYDEFQLLGETSFVKKPDKVHVYEMVSKLFELCMDLNPEWLSVPQIPFNDGAEYNRINRELAEASLKWKTKARCKCQFVLPAIFTHQRQTSGKTQWNKKITQIEKCVNLSGAKVIWTVDSSLDDSSGQSPNEKRLSEMIRLHKHLNQVFQKQKHVAGPYWALNLVLWSRGLCNYPAVGLGNSYQYFIPGTETRPGKVRIPLSPLCRRAVASPPLKQWLLESKKKLNPSDREYKVFNNLLKDWRKYTNKDGARELLAMYYRRWFDDLRKVNPEGRSVALFQMFSSAFVVGSNLEPLPDSEKSREPAKVAQQFMNNCLT